MERCAERDPVLPERESGHWKEGEGELVGLRCLLERGVCISWKMRFAVI